MDYRSQVAWAVQTVWNIIDGDDVVDPWLWAAGQELGNLFRAWIALEEAWVAGISIEELLDYVPLDSIEASTSRDNLILWLSDLPARMAGDLEVWGLSELLHAVLKRQSIYIVDASSVLTGPASAWRTEREWVGSTSEYASYPELATRCAIGSLRGAVAGAGRALGSVDAAEKLLRLPVGSGATLVARPGDGKTGIFETQPASVEDDLLLNQLRSDRVTAKQLLTSAVYSDPENVALLFALGTYLALAGKFDEARTWLEKASDIAGSDVAVEYMLVDLSVASGVATSHSTGRLISLPDDFDEGEFEELSGAGHLAVRGLMVELGHAEPYSPRVDGARVPVPWEDLGDMKRDIKEMRAAQEALRLSHEQARTEAIAQNRRLERALDRSDFWIQLLATNLPDEQHKRVTAELSEVITSWSKLPPVTTNELVAARFVTDLPALSDGQRCPNVIRALGLAVESLARTVLPELQAGADLGDIATHVDDIQFGPEAFRRSLQDLRQLRNQASHSPGRMKTDDMNRAWIVVLGTKGVPGIIETFATFRN